MLHAIAAATTHTDAVERSLVFILLPQNCASIPGTLAAADDRPVSVLIALRDLNSAGKRLSVLIGQMMTPTTPGKRVALVIGNSVYRNVPAVENTINDAHAISTTFASIGYTVID